MDELQQKIVDYVEANGKTYQQIALEIHEKPEVSNYEFFASKRLADQIKSVGFEVEMPAAGHRTGFAASYKSGKPGPVMVFLAVSTEHLVRKAERTEARREASSVRDILRTSMRLFPHIRASVII